MRIALAASLALLVLLLAACGGSGKSSSAGAKMTPIAFVKSSAAKTSQAPSEHFAFTGTVDVGGQAVTVNGNGDFDNTAHQGSVHSDFNVAGLSGTIDEVLDGTTIYMKSPLFADGLPKGKTWLKLDLQKVGAAKGIDFSALMSQSPQQAFAQLESSGQVHEVGDETVDGVDATHYTGTIDPSKLAQGAKVEALTGAKYGPYDIWIGKDDGYVRRVKLSYSLKPKGATTRETITTTMDFSDFGKTVSVAVPSDADSYDATNASIAGLAGQ